MGHKLITQDRATTSTINSTQKTALNFGSYNQSTVQMVQVQLGVIALSVQCYIVCVTWESSSSIFRRLNLHTQMYISFFSRNPFSIFLTVYRITFRDAKTMVYHLYDCKLFCLNDLGRTDVHRRFLTSFLHFFPRSRSRSHTHQHARAHKEIIYNSQNKSTVQPIFNGHLGKRHRRNTGVVASSGKLRLVRKG